MTLGEQERARSTDAGRPGADGPPAPSGVGPIKTRRRGSSSSHSRGVVLRLLIVLVLLTGAGGAIVVTKPQVLSSFGTSAQGDPGTIGTLDPDQTEPGAAPPSVPLVPGVPIGPMAPPGLGPLAPGGLPPGALPPGALPPGALAPGAAAPAAGLGIADVLGALFDSAKGDWASHFDNSGGEGLIQDGFYPSVVRNPLLPSRQAYQFAIGPGGLRSEVLPVGPGTQPVNGEQQFVRYSALTSRDFPVNTTEYNIIMQWHHQSNTGSPPLALQIERGQLMMVSGGDDYQSIGPVAPGQPINLTMQVRFSMDPSLGAVTVWRDGKPTGVTNWHPVRGTMFTPGAYLKMGMYRSRSILQGGALTITDLKIGRTPDQIGGLGPLALR